MKRPHKPEQPQHGLNRRSDEVLRTARAIRAMGLGCESVLTQNGEYVITARHSDGSIGAYYATNAREAMALAERLKHAI